MNDINSAYDRLMTINDIFSNFILETNFIRKDDVISWPSYKSGNSKFLYAREYEHLLNSRQYSFLFTDKSFIQCYYNFSLEHGISKIKEVKLCYYPYPVHLKERLDDFEDMFDNTDDDNLKQYYFDLYLCMSEEFGFNVRRQIESARQHFQDKYGYDWQGNDLRGLAFDKVYEATNYSHLRMDYDSNVTTHHKCELQFGAIKNLRLPVDRILDPFLFFDLVFRYFFKNDYKGIIDRKYMRNFIIGRKSSSLISSFKEKNIFKTLDL